jgi:hypothetical protein
MANGVARDWSVALEREIRFLTTLTNTHVLSTRFTPPLFVKHADVQKN